MVRTVVVSLARRITQFSGFPSLGLARVSHFAAPPFEVPRNLQSGKVGLVITQFHDRRDRFSP